MPFIQNIPLMDVSGGWYKDPGANGVLIQIVDNDMYFPKPKTEFEETYQYKFLDVSDTMQLCEGVTKITEDEAEQIANVLKKALKENRNVIVHCHAGVARSGAVVEAGIKLGFEDTGKFRAPNKSVLEKILKYC